MQDCRSKNSIQQEDSLHQQIGFKFKKKTRVKCYMWSIALYAAETWTVRKVDQRYLGSF
jgi:hypothetical protein